MSDGSDRGDRADTALRVAGPVTGDAGVPSAPGGTAVACVRRALAEGDPLPGTAGFAGRVDGRLLRDPLGRIPLFLDRDPAPGGPRWAFRPAALVDPVALPAGSALPVGDRRDGRADADDGDRPLAPADADRVWGVPDPDPGPRSRDPAAAVDRVRAVLPGTGPPDPDSEPSPDPDRDPDRDPELVPDGVPVAFSSGVDSGLVAAASGGPLYVAGFPDSDDVAAARAAARAMGRAGDLRVVELDHGRLERAAAAVARATGRTNAMDVAIGAVLYAVADRVAADGYDRLAVGQGADELFGGYEKVAEAPEDDRVAADTVGGARRETVLDLPDQLARDVPVLWAAGVDPVAPFLHDRVVRSALSVPGPALVGPNGERKYALRLAARDAVPDRVAFRGKRAAQYGSLVARELDRIARRAGYKRRIGDHVSKYVASLLGD